MKTKKTALIRARLQEDLNSALRLYCEKNNVTITHVLETLLEELLKKEGMLK